MAATKIRAPDMCQGFLSGDAGALDHGKEHEDGAHQTPSPESVTEDS